MIDLKMFDNYLKNDGPAALVIRQNLMPVEGEDGVLFPATYASGDNFPGGYNIDTDASGSTPCPAGSRPLPPSLFRSGRAVSTHPSAGR